MKNKKFSLLVLALSMAFILACGVGVVRGSGRLVTETRDVSGFDSVEIHDGGNLYLVQGDGEALEIEAEENIMPYLSSRVVNHTLILEFDDSVRRSFITTRPINYYLTMEDIHGLEISGGGDIRADDISTNDLTTNISGGGNLEIKTLEADYLKLSISGGGDIEIRDITTTDLNTDISGGGNLDIDTLKADTLDMSISGGGDIRINDGVVDKQDLRISGGGKYDAPDLESQDVTARVSGGGDLIIRAEESLDIEVSGGSSVYYYGKPSVNSSISGGGDIIQRDK